MRSATVRQLQIFSVAASHLSFARAAEKLHLTHAAISLQIKQLEDVCGTLLFDRIGKKVFLTEAGDILLDHARQILQSLKDADESLMALKGLKGGRVAIAVTSTAEYFAPGLLAEFRKAQADVRVRLLVDNREEVSRMLISNEVDLAIMGRPPADMEAEAVSFAPIVRPCSGETASHACGDLSADQATGGCLRYAAVRSYRQEGFSDRGRRYPA